MNAKLEKTVIMEKKPELTLKEYFMSEDNNLDPFDNSNPSPIDEGSGDDIDLPIEPDGIVLKGSIYYTINTPSKAPWIINCPGLMLHRGNYLNNFFSEKTS